MASYHKIPKKLLYTQKTAFGSLMVALEKLQCVSVHFTVLQQKLLFTFKNQVLIETHLFNSSLYKPSYRDILFKPPYQESLILLIAEFSFVWRSSSNVSYLENYAKAPSNTKIEEGNFDCRASSPISETRRKFHNDARNLKPEGSTTFGSLVNSDASRKREKSPKVIL